MIAVRGCGNFLGIALDARLGFPGTLFEACLTFVIGEIMAVGVVGAEPDLALAGVEIPSDEIEAIIETVAAGADAFVFGLVSGPGAVQRLRIALGGGNAAPRDKTQDIMAGRLGIVAKGAFVAHDRHLHMDRRAPALFGLFRLLEPAILLIEDVT